MNPENNLRYYKLITLLVIIILSACCGIIIGSSYQRACIARSLADSMESNKTIYMLENNGDELRKKYLLALIQIDERQISALEASWLDCFIYKRARLAPPLNNLRERALAVRNWRANTTTESIKREASNTGRVPATDK